MANEPDLNQPGNAENPGSPSDPPASEPAVAEPQGKLPISTWGLIRITEDWVRTPPIRPYKSPDARDRRLPAGKPFADPQRRGWPYGTPSGPAGDDSPNNCISRVGGKAGETAGARSSGSTPATSSPASAGHFVQPATSPRGGT